MRYRFGEYELDTSTFRLTSGSDEIPLEPQVFDLLAYLVEQRDRVVTKNELLDRVWGNRFVSESALTSRVKSARQAVGDDGIAQQVIRTAHGRGYQFVAPVSAVPPSAGPAPETSVSVQLRAPVRAPVRVTGPPSPVTTIIGREREIDAVSRLLRTSRIITLLGPGGVGKTRLAIEVAKRCTDAFPHGVCFVALADLRDARLVPRLIADALGLPTEDAEDAERLGEALHGLALLLVLDNVEHVLGAVPFVSRLLAGADRLTVLSTSRERLRMVGEQTVQVEPLGLEDDGTGALTLFERSARAVSPGFVLNDSNRAAVTDICRAVEGLPLAVELAAAATRVLTPGLILDRLRTRLGALRSDLRDRPDRHRTMRSTIAWSLDGLEPPHRRLLARLAVFAAPVPLQAVSAVCAEPGVDVTDMLTDLIDKSLVRRFVGSDGEPWFTMLELIREGAAEMPEASSDREIIRRRHASEIALALTNLEADRWGPAAAYWINVIKARWSDIEAAYDWARADGDFRLAAEIAAPLYAYWHRVGHHAQGTTWTQQSLADAEELSPMTTALLHLGAGYLNWAHRRMDAARDHWETALGICRDLGSGRYVSFCLAQLAGLSIGHDGGYAGALRRCEEGIERARRTGELPLLATALTIKGELTRVHGDHDAALAAYEEAQEALRRAGDPHESLIILNLAYLAAPEEARRLQRAALATSADMGHWMTAAFAISEIGGTECYLGRPERAARLVGAADEALRVLGAARHSGDIPEHERVLQRLDEELGGQRFGALRRDGARLSIVDAISYALGERDPFASPGPAGAQPNT